MNVNWVTYPGITRSGLARIPHLFDPPWKKSNGSDCLVHSCIYIAHLYPTVQIFDFALQVLAAPVPSPAPVLLLTSFGYPLRRSHKIPEDTSISQCSRTCLTFKRRRKASVPSTKPFAVNILAGDYVPHQANAALQLDGSLL